MNDIQADAITAVVRFAGIISRPPFWRKSAELLGRMTFCPVILLALAIGIANAQTTSQFASGVSSPQGGMVMSGTGINPATGQPFRHLWSADAVNGLCRLDPDIDTPGLHSINPGTCLKTAAGIVFQPGQLALDPTTNDLYALDQSANKLGVFRLHFLPGSDSGHGLVDPAEQEVLGGIAAGGRGDNCGIGVNQPITMVLGPDGSLYLGFKRSFNITRILAPQTEPLPCTNIQSQAAISPDVRSATGLAWIGHDLYGMDTRTTFRFANGDQCFTPQNGFTPCVGGLSAFLIGAPAILASDQNYPSLNGSTLFYAGL
ncbi:MAG TPA: hypothetical protein VN345_10360, partial [Blastocatellia bacterium]|nr:hypothetical protein [Blastocatellia bacterium]